MPRLSTRPRFNKEINLHVIADPLAQPLRYQGEQNKRNEAVRGTRVFLPALPLAVPLGIAGTVLPAAIAATAPAALAANALGGLMMPAGIAYTGAVGAGTAGIVGAGALGAGALGAGALGAGALGAGEQFNTVRVPKPVPKIIPQNCPELSYCTTSYFLDFFSCTF